MTTAHASEISLKHLRICPLQYSNVWWKSIFNLKIFHLFLLIVERPGSWGHWLGQQVRGKNALSAQVYTGHSE